MFSYSAKMTSYERYLSPMTFKGLGYAILGNFSTDRMVIELNKISK